MTRHAKALGQFVVAVALFAGHTLAAQSLQSSAVRLPGARLAAGDDVVVVVFQEKELSARVYVDGRNQIALPRLGVFDVGSMTTDMLRDTVRARYATFLREPSVDVRALRRVTVNGAVLKPDVYYVDPSLTLRDVIARSGGVTSEGNTHKVTVREALQSTSISRMERFRAGAHRAAVGRSGRGRPQKLDLTLILDRSSASPEC